MGNFSIFEGGIKNTSIKKDISIEKFIELLKSNIFKNDIEHIRTIKDKTLRNATKEHLSYVTFAGIFKERDRKGFVEPSGYVCLDIDNITEQMMESTAISLKNNPRTHLMFTSPSGNGFKVVIKIPLVKDDKEYKEYWESVRSEYSGFEIDLAAKDISRACYVSYEPTPYYNLNSLLHTSKVVDNRPTEMFELDGAIIDIIVSSWLPGKRQSFAMYLSAVLRKMGYGMISVNNIIKTICEKSKDPEVEQRLKSVKYTFEKDDYELKGHSGLKEIMGDDNYQIFCTSLDFDIIKQKKLLSIVNKTKHIKMYKDLDAALGLIGSKYNILKKALMYSIVGNAIKENDKYIEYKGTKFDTRESISVVANSGGGKNSMSNFFNNVGPFGDEVDEVVSFHPEQLVGRMITTEQVNEETGKKEKIKMPNYGYLHKDRIVIDEARKFVMNLYGIKQDEMRDAKAYICKALNPMGDNLVKKHLTADIEGLSYFGRCAILLLFQPTKISAETIEGGFLRRFLLLEAVEDEDIHKSIYIERTKGTSKQPNIDLLCDYCTSLRDKMSRKTWIFDNIENALSMYAGLLYDYGLTYSDKSSEFVRKIYAQSIYDKLLKFSCITTAMTKENKEVTEKEVKIAYMDLFELLTNMFETIDKYSEDFYSFDLSHSDILLLKWLKKRGALSATTSDINIETSVTKFSQFSLYTQKQAYERFNTLRKSGFINIQYGKHSAIVYISQKGLKQIENMFNSTGDNFYVEYLKIADEVEKDENFKFSN